MTKSGSSLPWLYSSVMDQSLHAVEHLQSQNSMPSVWNNIWFWKTCTPNKPQTYAYISIPWNIQAKGKEARLGLKIFFFFFSLLKTSLVKKAKWQNSGNNVLNYTGENQGTEKGAALPSRVWGCCQGSQRQLHGNTCFSGNPRDNKGP